MRGSTRQVVVCVSHLEVGGGWYGGERRGDVTVGGDVSGNMSEICSSKW